MMVEFSEGQSRQAINVIIINDDVIEEPESFAVQLSDPVNGILGDDVMAVVNINDEDG